MSIPKKVYPTAVLKTLPDEKQQAIIDYCDGDGEQIKPHSISATVAWLREDGINTSPGALSSWRSWFLLRKQIALNEQSALEMAAECKDKGWIKTAEDEQAAGQVFFTRLAMSQQDNLGFVRIMREQTRQEQTKIERQKSQRASCALFLEWLENKRVMEIANKPASNADKIEMLGKEMFGEDW